MTTTCLHPAVFRPLHARFLTIPQAPLCYWLRKRFFELLAGRTLGHVAEVCQGLATANDARFVRLVWEVPANQWARPVPPGAGCLARKVAATASGSAAPSGPWTGSTAARGSRRRPAGAGHRGGLLLRRPGRDRAKKTLDKGTSRHAKSRCPGTREAFLAQERRFDPDRNDGVRVNIAPLQKAGLLAAAVLAAKDGEKAIADRAQWRADERRRCRKGKLPQPGWWKEY